MKSNIAYICTVIVAACVILAAACGKKAPPVPPEQAKPKPVNDLSRTIEDSKLNLSWSIPDLKSKTRIKGFFVYRSKDASSEPECEGCPIRFKQVSDISIDDEEHVDLSANRVVYKEKLKQGYRYVYKVNGYNAEDIMSDDSNYVRFEY